MSTTTPPTTTSTATTTSIITKVLISEGPYCSSKAIGIEWWISHLPPPPPTFNNNIRNNINNQVLLTVVRDDGTIRLLQPISRPSPPLQPPQQYRHTEVLRLSIGKSTMLPTVLLDTIEGGKVLPFLYHSFSKLSFLPESSSSSSSLVKEEKSLLEEEHIQNDNALYMFLPELYYRLVFLAFPRRQTVRREENRQQ